jgi:predicted transcriptional regulator
MKASDFSSAERLQHQLQVWEHLYNGIYIHAEIARRLGLSTSDSHGGHKDWYVWNIVQSLLTSGYVVKVGYRKYKITEDGFDWFMSSPLGNWALTDWCLR